MSKGKKIKKIRVTKKKAAKPNKSGSIKKVKLPKKQSKIGIKKKVKKSRRQPGKNIARRAMRGENITAGELSIITESACQTGAWRPNPGLRVGDQVDIADELGTVIFFDTPCPVTASDSGIISWIQVASQVNAGFPVCRIEIESTDV